MSIAWTAFYWADHLADTAHLSLAEHGAYILLMSHYYKTRRPLPANAEQVHRICRCTTDADRAASDFVLAEFFTMDGDVYRHGRIDRELDKASNISEKRRSAAFRSHRQPRRKTGANAPANAEQMHTQPQPQSQPYAQPQSQEESPPQPRKRSTPSDAGASAASASESSDARHAPLRELIQELYAEKFRIPCQWDASEGKALALLLKSNPGWTKDDIVRMVRNRFDSEGIAPSRPRSWIPKLDAYAAGPLDRFGKPITETCNVSNRAKREEQQTHDAIAGAARRYVARRASGEADGVGESSLDEAAVNGRSG